MNLSSEQGSVRCPAASTSEPQEGLMAKRQLRLGAFMRPVGIHTGWWRYPGAYPDANFNFQHLKRFAQTLERGRFDAFFMADHLAVLNMPIKVLRRSATATSFEPFTVLCAWPRLITSAAAAPVGTS